MLTSLALDVSSLVVALGNGSGEVAIGWHHSCHRLIVASLLVASCVAIHLVDADADLLHAQQADQPRC